MDATEAKAFKRRVRAEIQARELAQFVNVLKAAGNVVECEIRFDARPADSTAEPPIPRKWKFDLAMPNCQLGKQFYLAARYENIAIEIEGYGRHQSMKGFTDDVSKYAEAFAQGWILLRVTRKMIANCEALDYLARRGVRVDAVNK